MFRRDLPTVFCYFLATIILGFLIERFQFNEIEEFYVLHFQNVVLNVVPVQVFVIITYLGDLRFLLIVSTLYFAYSYYRLRRLDNGFKLLAFLAIVTLSTYILKEIFRRERPYLYSADIIPYTDDNGFSYPSGHVSRSLGAYAIIFGKSREKNMITITLTTLISLSRIVLGAHYITDLVGAVFLTLFSLKVTGMALKIVNNKINEMKRLIFKE